MTTANSKSDLTDTLVMKFGGTSVGDLTAIRQAAAIVAHNRMDRKHIVVVTSALAGVTNLLMDSAQAASKGKSAVYRKAVKEIERKHTAILEGLHLEQTVHNQVKDKLDGQIKAFSNLCQAIAILGEASPRALDAIGSIGERMSVQLLWAAIEQMGMAARVVDAAELIVTDDHYQSAHPDLKASSLRIQRVVSELFALDKIPVVTGFIAATAAGVTTTLGRGGSDYSAAILGAALPAEEVWIWTDVDGVMTADPKVVSNAATIEELSYREVAELAYYGAKVLHPKTIRPIIDARIGLRVCNTFNPDHPGTRIVPDSKPDGLVKAVTAIRKIALITIEGRGMLGVPGVAARTFAAVATIGVSVPLITQASSEQSICFAVPIESSHLVVSSLQKAFSEEIQCKDIDQVWATGEVVVVTVVGAGMQSTPGIAGKVFNTLGVQNVNVIAIAQGSSEVSISLVVKAEEADTAIRALHEMIVHLGGKGEGAA
jgi:aspartokinase/homoserine dehydrogenase 1